VTKKERRERVVWKGSFPLLGEIGSSWRQDLLGGGREEKDDGVSFL